MDEQKILEKIAYCYYEKFRDMGYAPDRDRDWRYAVNALAHLKTPQKEGDWWWSFHEENYGEFRVFLEGAVNE